MTIIVILFLLPVASYRLTRLITKDTFPPILWLRDRLAGGWRPLTMAESRVFHNAEALNDHEGVYFVTTDIGEVTNRWVNRADWSPDWIAELLSCPWCASAYTSAALTVWGALWEMYAWPMALLVWLYAWGVAAVVASKEWA